MDKLSNSISVSATKETLSNLFIVGITGSTRSGKTSLAKNLQKVFGEKQCKIIGQDRYFDYNSIAELKGNWELPEAINFDSMLTAINKTIEEMKKLPGEKYLILEGFQLFSDQRIIDLVQVKIWLEISEEVIYYRRMNSTRVPEDYFYKKLIPAYRDYQIRCKNIKHMHVVSGELDLQEVLKQALAIVRKTFNSTQAKSL